MLEIFIENKKIDLPADISIEITLENPFMLSDTIPAAYSMSFNLPGTNRNNEKFRNPGRFASIGEWNELNSYIRFGGIVILEGKLQVWEVQKSINVNFVNSKLVSLLKKKLTALSSVAEYDYNFGAGDRYNPDFDSGWALAYKNCIIDNMKDLGNEFAACPVRVENEEWDGPPPGPVSGGGVHNALRMYFNAWNVYTGNYMFTTSSASKRHGIVYPQPYIYKIIERFFDDKLASNFLASNDELKSLVIMNSYHRLYTWPTLYSLYKGVLLDNYYGAATNSMHIASFLNNYAFNLFLKEILKIFCCTLLIRPDGKFEIVHKKIICDSTDVVDWSDRLADEPVISIQKKQKYIYGYKDERTANIEAQYTEITSIVTLLDAGTPAGVYKISYTNEIYEKEEILDAPGTYTYNRVDSGLGGNEKSEDDIDEFNITSEISPLRMKIDEYWYNDSSPTHYKWHIAEFTGDRLANDFAPRIGFVRGFCSPSTFSVVKVPENYEETYPYLTPYNGSPGGEGFLGDYSLVWEGYYGLINQFHNEFKEWVEKDKHVLKGLFKLTNLDLKNIDYKKKVYVRGMLFFIKKIEVTIRANSMSLCNVELVEA